MDFNKVKIKGMEPFQKQNPEFSILDFNFHDNEQLANLKWDGGDKENLLGELKTYQRLLRIYPDITAAQTLQEKGIDSAFKITALSRNQFVKEYGPLLGEHGEAKAVEIHIRAENKKNQVMHMWAAAQNITTPHFKTMRVNSINSTLTDFFERMPSYRDIFGSLDYCECDQCKSIFGPAAYFVDLMRIAEIYVNKPNEKTIPPGMKLSERRPDLANIKLTCENTNRTMPYLRIVNERLEDIVSRTLQEQCGLYQALANKYYPLNLPFQLPLERIRQYLKRLNVELWEIYESLGSSVKDRAAEYLELSPEEWQLLTTRNTGEDKLKEYYGVTELSQLADAETFCRQTGLKFRQLHDLLYQNLSDEEIKNGLTGQFFINQSLPAYLSLETDGERQIIKNLNNNALDQINRFLRLVRKTGWSYATLDWILHCVNKGIPFIDDGTLAGIAAIKELESKLNIPTDTVCALLFDLKTYGVGKNSTNSEAPFDCIFNGPGMETYRPKYTVLNPMYTQDVRQWQIAADNDINRKTAVRIASGVGMSQEDVKLLAVKLFGIENPVNITVENLSMIYRHAKLAALIGLPMPRYLKFMDLFGACAPGFTAGSILETVQTTVLLKRSGINVFELDYIANGNTSPFVDTFYREQDTEAWLKTLPALAKSTALTAEEQQKEQEEKIIEQLAAFFNAKTEQIKALLSLAGHTGIVPVFLDTAKKEEARSILKDLSRYLVLVRKLKLKSQEIESIRDYSASYGIQDAKKLSAGNIINILRFKDAGSVYDDPQDHLTTYMNAANGGDAARELAALTGQDEEQIKMLGEIFKNDNRMEILCKTGRVYELVQKTGTNLSFLISLHTLAGKSVTGSWDAYAAAADNLINAVKARYAADVWNKIYDQIEGEEQESKREALIGIAVSELSRKEETQWIKNSRNLYEYLLIDVEMSGCAQISYIKEALNAVQIYLTRCRKQLEPGAEFFSIPEVWWEWMMNYRVWEANRKIFLYPENYIDPAHRNSKTQLFKELENSLKQGDINSKTVETAYKKYLDNFAELAKLVYVDAYYCNISDEKREDAPTLFLFARTQTQPYNYYYIIQENDGTWSEWNKVELTINSEHIAPMYAFNRLFVFWVEFNKSDDTQDASKKITKHKASIKYTFYNFSGDWVQPQTLVENMVISVQGGPQLPGYNGLFSESLFDTNHLWWKKVYAYKLEKNRYWVLGSGANKFEKIMLLYGPMLNTGDFGEWTAPAFSQPSSNEDFYCRLDQAAKNFKAVKDYGYEGCLPVFNPVIINDDLEKGFLADPNEFILLRNDSPQSITCFRPNIDSISGRLNLISTKNILYDNCNEAQITDIAPVKLPDKLTPDSFVSSTAGIQAADSERIFKQLLEGAYIDSKGMPGNIDFSKLYQYLKSITGQQPDQLVKINCIMENICRSAGTPCLSGAMRNKNYEIFTVKNHPAAFVFKGEKESFLLCDPDKNLPSISRCSYNSDTLFKPDSFISLPMEINEKSSESIFNQLVQYGYLYRDGRLSTDTVLTDLTKDLRDLFAEQPREDDKVAVVKNILMHRPVIRPGSFVSEAAKIEESSSQAIFKQLMLYGYLDQNGRLDGDIDYYSLTQDVADVLKDQPDQDKKVRCVVDTLYQSAFPTSVGFFASKDQGYNICEFKLKATRMTTAAVHRLSSALFTGSIDKLLSLDSQQIPVESELPFSRFQFNDLKVEAPEVLDGAQVDFYGTYGLYYWELFFHAPMFIYNLLKTNQKFQDAENWLKYIFNTSLPENPVREDSFQTSTLGIRDSRAIYKILLNNGIITAEGLVNPSFTRKTPLDTYLKTILNQVQIESVKNILLNYKISKPVARFWQFQPFRNHTLESLIDQLKNPGEIAAYNNTPFDPHAIARLRIGAYEKSVVMQYIDNLLDWGDALFARYSWEFITAATLLYICAYNLLGERPESIGTGKTPAPVSFKDIFDKYQYEIPQFLIELEHATGQNPPTLTGTPFNEFDTYFCIPENTEFMAYWDRVEDRLYKIRHCLNINGVKQNLPLFEPPLDPAQLARLAAAGSDIISVISHGSTGVPHYRFNYILEKAKNITGTLSQLGSSLLSVLEKKDAEALALLRSTHEKNILNLTTLSKEKQIEEITETTASLQQNRSSAQNRLEHYQSLYDENLNALEIASLTLSGTSIALQVVSGCIRGLSMAGYLIPNVYGLANGGMQFGDAINAGAQVIDVTAGIMNQTAGIIATGAQYVRRREEWKLQCDIASYEVEQLNKQISANQARQAYLTRELEIHQKNIQQADEYEDFIKNKFTGQDLYQWMMGRISTVYFQTYRMALDMALAAQAAYRNELCRDDQFIEFSYWDSLRKGLLSGESLLLSLSQMEKSYIENNPRRLEIEKTISLLHLDPQKFMEFKWGINGAERGKISFELSEKLFDFDFPGHYCRKIKSVSVTIPAVVRPYQNINATLVQNNNKIVLKPDIKAIEHVIDPSTYPDNPGGSLREDWLPNQQIAITRGIDDSGLFLLDFRDEQYLPFEGTGAVSRWTLHLPPETNRIDFNSISDIILQIKYTAQEGGENLANQVKALLHADNPPYPYTLAKSIDLKQSYAGEWNKFINSQPSGNIQQVCFPITDEMLLPNLTDVQLSTVSVFLQTPPGLKVSDKDSNTGFVYLRTGDGTSSPVSITDNAGNINLSKTAPAKETWALELDTARMPAVLLAEGAVNAGVLLDIVVLIGYESNVFNKPKQG
ncbi:virulence plasmid 28.1 kDa A protein [Desulfofarcimen acetoxidans DSM 771]|uniref:Virulence plasmid 28.1 kDa A protein n=1 Tax=Desulfofarcimen acetoxidans (strain ATCC 49208 / DSM 771 / KCTC 5769 / VKM B-1644 / 5575) TaxID=485916 RepID=C8W2F0_DESAS|nr:neuraminidase-like domain-containing protein [Desulfofarcimen acetoxidans]ACV63634.1 virulence plasmid 28.1 kDa A protein [Desulfofarcimen acetoxidans DSM 771]